MISICRFASGLVPLPTRLAGRRTGANPAALRLDVYLKRRAAVAGSQQQIAAAANRQPGDEHQVRHVVQLPRSGRVVRVSIAHGRFLGDGGRAGRALPMDVS